jgi:hypothetical protein
MCDTRNPSSDKDRLILLALGLSMATNLALAVQILMPAAGKLPEPAPLSTQTESPAPTPRQPLAQTETPPPPAPAEPPAPFHWSQIEHEDYRQYIANLRSVGCPEATIRDLIAADLSQQYAPRAAAIWQRTPVEYWQKYENQEPTPAQLKEIKALSREQSAVFQSLLDSPMDQQQLIDLVYLQIHGSQQQLLFLPDAKREAASRALADVAFEQREREQQNRSFGYSRDSEKTLFEEKLQILSKVLSPAELDEFQLRHSPTAQKLRMEVQYFDATPEEFKQLLEAREKDGDRITPGDLMNRGPATEQVRELFGEERAREFEKVSDMYYQNARRTIDGAGLPVEYADQVWQISRDTRAAADHLASDSRLTVEERKRRLQELRTQADQQLNDLLGEKTARPIRRDLGVPIHVAEANLKP